MMAGSVRIGQAVLAVVIMAGMRIRCFVMSFVMRFVMCFMMCFWGGVRRLGFGRLVMLAMAGMCFCNRVMFALDERCCRNDRSKRQHSHSTAWAPAWAAAWASIIAFSIPENDGAQGIGD